MKPVDIAHSRRENALTITWDDGIVSRLEVPYLRGWCPCATCQGHGKRVKFREPPGPVTAEGIYEMGSYAIAVRYSDGHDAGIYSWTWLRRIAPESPPSGLKRGAFEGERYFPS